MGHTVLHAVKAEIAGRVLRNHHVPAGHDGYAFFRQAVHNLAEIGVFQRRPFQINFRPGIDQLRSQCESIDICNSSKDRIIRDICQQSVLRHGSGNGAHKEFRLVHAGIVCPYVPVGSIQGAVQYPDIRIIYRRLHACLDKLRRRGEYNIAAFLNGVPDGLLR